LRAGGHARRLLGVADERDVGLRQAALDRVRELQRRYDDLMPLAALRRGFEYGGRRISFGSFYSGIFRPAEMAGPAALSLVTAPPKADRPPPYEDGFDETSGRFVYRFRDPSTPTLAALRHAEADNEALLAAHRLAVPVIYFKGIAPAQYSAIAPAFVVAVDREERHVEVEAGLPLADAAGITSPSETRRYATREALVRLHQHRFRTAVLRAYTTRCAVCRLKEASLLQAAHIIDDRDARGEATVVNGIALCAIHHLAYDRNLLGIDPRGVVHISRRLLAETDGPMLQQGLQGFHGAHILQPRRPDERPDPLRLDVRFQQFAAAA
jgi:putative restriction endonuclease